MFSFFSILTLLAGVAVVSFKRPLYAALSLSVCLFSLAVLFYLMEAPFAALLEVLVYIGAIMTLFLFVIMMIAYEEEKVRLFPDVIAVASVLAGCFLLGLVPLLAQAPENRWRVHFIELAASLYKSYLIPFEAVSILLLVAITGVVFFTRIKEKTG